MNRKIGVIGTGRLGGMLIKAMIRQAGVAPGRLYIYNRTKEKLHSFNNEFFDINVAESVEEVIKCSDWIFLCIKPLDLPSLLSNLDTKNLNDKVIISTLVVPTLAELEKLLICKVVRVYPSITQSTGHGVTLMAFGDKLIYNDKKEIISFFNLFGNTYVVPEEQFRSYGDITSCGPAFMAYMIGTLAEIAAEKNLDIEIAKKMALETMLGTTLMLKEEGISFMELVEEVAAPGGTTEEGIKVLKNSVPVIYRELFSVTNQKQQKSLQKVLSILGKNLEKQGSI